MNDYLLSAISCLCILSAGLCAEECSLGILARRDMFPVPEGGSLSLTCVVEHCGKTWTGSWRWKNSTDKTFSVIKNSDRHVLTNKTLSANKTQLVLNLRRVILLDEGSYGCSVTWGQGDTDVGNMMYLNITAAVPSERNVWHRISVCAGAFLCLPVILGLACCVSSRVKPQPFPRTQPIHVTINRDQPHPAPQPPPRRPVPQKRSISSHKAPPKSQQKTEVVYADISRDAMRQQGATREPAQSTVYSSVKFS